MKIEAELVEFWCAEMHNKDMCMGQYYAEDDWSRKVYARSAEELHEKILWSMSDIDLEGVDITKVMAIEYEDVQYISGDETNADAEFMQIMGISGTYLSSGYFKNHPENVARLERERILEEERVAREKLEREKEREKAKLEAESRKAKADELAQSDDVQRLLKLAESQGLKVEIK